MIRKATASTIACLLLGCAGNRTAVTSYPQMDMESANPILAVVAAKAGDYLPQFEQCRDPNTICMDPPPFWFSFEVREIIYGEVGQNQNLASTTSHYGIYDFESWSEKDLLMYLLSDGENIVMPRYSMKTLGVDVSGNYHVIVESDPAISWLPCSVSDAYSEFDPGMFGINYEVPIDRVHMIPEEELHLFSVSETGATPRFTLSVDALAEHLDSMVLTSEQMNCSD